MAGVVPPRGFGTGMLAVLIAVSVSSGSAPARQSNELRYQVAWGNMTLAEAKVSFALDEERYEIEGSGESLGTLAWLFPWKGSARTIGVTTAEDFQVLRHESEGSYRDRTRRTAVHWAPGEPLPRLRADPHPDLSEVTPVPESTTANTADPFTVLLRTLSKLKQGDRCEAEERVWDGRRRYDLTIEHIGRTDLEADRPWTYDGPAIGCRLIYKPIGGFRRDSRWSDKQDEIERVIWVGRLPDQGLVPVRIEFSAPIGKFVGRLYTD